MILPPFLIPKELYSNPAGISVKHSECSTVITMRSRHNRLGSLLSIFILFWTLFFVIHILNTNSPDNVKLLSAGAFILILFIVLCYNLTLMAGKRVVEIIPHSIVITDCCGLIVSGSVYSGSEISDLRMEEFPNFSFTNPFGRDFGIFFSCEGGDRICVAFSDDKKNLSRIFRLLETSTAFNPVSCHNKNTPVDDRDKTGVNDENDLYRINLDKM